MHTHLVRSALGLSVTLLAGDPGRRVLILSRVPGKPTSRQGARALGRPAACDPGSQAGEPVWGPRRPLGIRLTLPVPGRVHASALELLVNLTYSSLLLVFLNNHTVFDLLHYDHL